MRSLHATNQHTITLHDAAKRPKMIVDVDRFDAADPRHRIYDDVKILNIQPACALVGWVMWWHCVLLGSEYGTGFIRSA